MAYMFVTLDVSKLSGWLNAAASCQVERRAYTADEVGEAEGLCGAMATQEIHWGLGACVWHACVGAH